MNPFNQTDISREDFDFKDSKDFKEGMILFFISGFTIGCCLASLGWWLVLSMFF